MTAKATRSQPAAQSAAQKIETLRRFTPEQVVELGLTTYTVRTLKKLAQRRKIHHHREGSASRGRIYFTLDDLAKNNAKEQEPPIAIGA